MGNPRPSPCKSDRQPLRHHGRGQLEVGGCAVGPLRGILVGNIVELGAAALVADLTTRLPAFMVPRYVHVVEDLPRNATTGRVRKTEIRAAGLPSDVYDRTAMRLI